MTVKTFPTRIHTPPPRSLFRNASQAALLFKVKFLCYVACLRCSVPSSYELLVRVLIVLVAADERQGQERVEDHHENDVEVSIVISIPGGGEGRVSAGEGAQGGVGSGPVCLELVKIHVLEKLTTVSEQRNMKTLVCAFHLKIRGHVC